MNTTEIVSIIVSAGCLIFVISKIIINFIKFYRSDKITLVKGDKRITISRTPTAEERRKLLHF